MIYLQEVCSKLSEILNSDDNPTGFAYQVESVGFHADTTYKEGRNFIRVFVSSMGGNFNPVYGLGEANYTIPVTFYFPVRFKESMFVLDAYLHSTFVGAGLVYGVNSGRAISNLSVATYGEIQDLDFKEFRDWANKLYRLPIEIMEPYMSMTVNLYLTTINANYLMGNDATAKIKFELNMVEWEEATPQYADLAAKLGYQGVRCEKLDFDKAYLVPPANVHFYAFVTEGGVIYVDIDATLGGTGKEVFTYVDGVFKQVGNLLNSYSPSVYYSFEGELTFAQASTQGNSQASEQIKLFGSGETEGLAYSETTSQSFGIYPKTGTDTFLYRILILWHLLGIISQLELTLALEIPAYSIEFEKPVYVAGFNLPINKGNPLTITLSLAKRLQ